MSQRIVKIDRNNKSIIIRALHAVYQQRKLAGQGCSAEGALILRVNESAEGKLRLSDNEYLVVRAALNQLRDERIAAGGCTDAIDEALYKLLKARQKSPFFFLA